MKPLVGCTCTDHLPFVPIDDLTTRYYLRFVVADRSGVLAATANVFAQHDVSVHSVIQRGTKSGEGVDLVYVTHTAQERNIRAVIADICKLDGVLAGHQEPTVIRVES